jgi:L-alanine-DL-glutamate epimerase-like enolase superfamily enzyme|tara:strand:+ start:140 stop:1288 length:1149 start_codon:yes stop_codon:yes gene_type:complete
MKIDKIDLYPVSVPYKVIEKSSRVYRSGVSDIIIKITTDDGIVGWGEATRTASAKVIIESLEAMKPVLMNQDPWQNLKHEKNIYDEALWHWSAVTANLAYAGIDMALWDIYGKQVNKPIYQLLGGSLRDEVSYFYYLTWTDINDLIKQCQDGINKGYDVFYLKIGKDEILEEEMVKVVRETIGPSKKIRLDTNMSWNIPQAKKLINKWHEKYSIDFFEAPVQIEPLTQMQELKSSISSSLCVNEGLWKENEFIDIINSRCGDYLCCSHYYVGSVRKFLHLAYLSNYYGWLICKHTHGELGLTAAIGQHLMLNIPNACEGHQQTAQNMVDDILTEPIPITNKPIWKKIEKPGLGVEVDEDKVLFYNKKFLEEGEFLPYGDTFK